MANCQGGGPNNYASGNCTWWVKQQIPGVPNWWHNGAEWFANAQACGWPTGQTAQVGAIACWGPGIDPGFGFGHVAIVKGVAGSVFTVSEMNYRGLGVVDTRNVSDRANLQGFIYPPGSNLLLGSFGTPTAATGPQATGPDLGQQLSQAGGRVFAAGQIGAGGLLLLGGVAVVGLVLAGGRLPGPLGAVGAVA